MNNSRHHSDQIKKPPSSINKKSELAEAFTSNNIAYPVNSIKNMIIAIVKQNQPDPIFIIDSLVQDNGHKVLRLPPYLCYMNPIDLYFCYTHINGV